MATVYLALDMRLDRTVALKVMHPSLAEDPEFVRRFIGEAKSAARLSHPNVVGVYDQGTDAGHVFLAMEYVPSRTLRDLLRERGRLNPSDALQITQRVLAALSAAHYAGIIHRDIKPENVLLAEDGRIKVADFGLARAVASTNHTKTSGLLIGTVAYLSPEQVSHGDADARSDVYSAGVMLFELLTGSQPFKAETPLAVAYKHVNENVPAPSSTCPDLPVAIDALVARATHRDPALRPADATQLLHATAETLATLTEGAAGAGTAAASLPAAETGHTTQVTPQGHNSTLVVSHEDASGGAGTQAGPAGPDGQTGPDGQAGQPASGQPWYRQPILIFAIVGAIVAALVLGGGLWWLQVGRWTTTPDLTSMELAQAKSKAHQYGFDVEVAEARYSNKVSKGNVVTTKPRPGEKIVNGGTVTLIPSKGPKMVAVPDVSGSPVAQAKDRLRQVGLKPGDTAQGYSSTVPKGSVISTKPGAGSEIRIDSTVDLVVSQGIKIPDVHGLAKEKALRKLSELGFEPVVLGEEHSEQPKGTVIAQTPSSGGAAAGTAIKLTLSKGPKPIPIPKVKGKTVKEAKKILEGAGFKVKVQTFGPGPKPVKHVRAVHPTGKAPKGATITIVAFF